MKPLSPNKWVVGILLIIPNNSNKWTDLVGAIHVLDSVIRSMYVETCIDQIRLDPPYPLASSILESKSLTTSIDFISSKVFGWLIIANTKHVLFP